MTKLIIITISLIFEYILSKISFIINIYKKLIINNLDLLHHIHHNKLFQKYFLQLN